jgi:hypothetical protein
MLRAFHTLAILLLIGSAIYVYKIKYATIALNGELVHLNKLIAAETDRIAVLNAEWQSLNRPERLQKLSEDNLDLVPLSTDKIVRWQDIPNRSDGADLSTMNNAKKSSAGAVPQTTVR